MIGRNKNWTGPSDWIKEFNRKHNPGFYYGKNKKTNQKSYKKQEGNTVKYKIFRQSDW